MLLNILAVGDVVGEGGLDILSRRLDGLRQETVRLGLLAEEGLGGETLRAIADRLEEPELERLRACYARRLEEKLPMPVQLRYDGGETGPEANDGSFVI